VLRDPAQSEEIAQEVLLEIWRTASRFDPAKGSPAAWALTIAHRRAVDRVRSETASSRREEKAAVEHGSPDDDVAEVVAAALDGQRVRRCLDGLTELQRESITLAYYGGYSYPQVARLRAFALFAAVVPGVTQASYQVDGPPYQLLLVQRSIHHARDSMSRGNK
jgi:RNA polymerase sigma-70 factor (ECF subfamily)